MKRCRRIRLLSRLPEIARLTASKKGDGYERERPRSNGISWEVFRDVGKDRAKSWEGPKGSSARQGLPQGKFGNFCEARIGRICLDFGSSTGWGAPRVDAPGVEDLPLCQSGPLQ